jgi:hypothetical protein
VKRLERKLCTKCRRTLTLRHFHKSKASGGYKPRCRACRAGDRKDYLKRNPDWRVTAGIRYLANREKISEEGKRRRVERRDVNRRYSYGISREDFQMMVLLQGGLCAICEQSPPAGFDLCVDHCHKTKRVRGLLCKQCNSGIGILKDDLRLLRNAVRYLEKHESRSAMKSGPSRNREATENATS